MIDSEDGLAVGVIVAEESATLEDGEEEVDGVVDVLLNVLLEELVKELLDDVLDVVLCVLLDDELEVVDAVVRDVVDDVVDVVVATLQVKKHVQRNVRTIKPAKYLQPTIGGMKNLRGCSRRSRASDGIQGTREATEQTSAAAGSRRGR